MERGRCCGSEGLRRKGKDEETEEEDEEGEIGEGVREFGLVWDHDVRMDWGGIV